MRLICTYEPLCAREGPFVSVRSSISAPMQRAAEARAGMDRDESTVMDRDTVIYHTVDADADSDGPGSDRDRAQAPPPPAPLARGCMRALKLSSLQYATRSSGHVRTLAPAVSTPLTRPPPHHVCILMGRRTRPVQDESTHARSSTRRCMRPVTCQRPCCCCCYCCCRRRRHRFPTGRPWRRGRGRR